jgi:tetratricopeptide (TPR) repeat protein
LKDNTHIKKLKLITMKKRMQLKGLTGFGFGFTLLVLLNVTNVLGKEGVLLKTDAAIQKAYDLRMSGKADQAAVALEQLLKSDSTNSMAYFELARTRYHLFLGGTQLTSEAWSRVMGSFQQAVKYAPANATYAFYYAYSRFLDAFISMMSQQPDVTDKINLACEAFDAVVKVDPKCYQALLYEMDIYGMLPPEMGGNREKANSLAEDIGKKDKIFGALANARLQPENADLVAFWQGVEQNTPMGVQGIEEMGRAYLLKSDSENGTKYFLEAIKQDPARRSLYMNLARFHLMSTQQDQANKETHLQEAEKLVNLFLTSQPALPAPFVAYGNGFLSLIRMVGGDQAGSDSYKGKAEAIDPFYSRATGMPAEMIYCRPEDVKIQYSSFFMPF